MCLDPPHWVPLLCSRENPTDISVLFTLAFYLGVAFHHQTLQVLIVSLAKNVRCHLWFDIEWKNEWTCMLDEHVGWHVQTIWIFIQHSSNIYSTFHPTCWIKCWIGLTRPLDDQWQKHLKRNQFIEKVKQSTLSHPIFGIAMVCISFHVKIIKVLVI